MLPFLMLPFLMLAYCIKSYVTLFHHFSSYLILIYCIISFITLVYLIVSYLNLIVSYPTLLYFTLFYLILSYTSITLSSHLQRMHLEVLTRTDHPYAECCDEVLPPTVWHYRVHRGWYGRRGCGWQSGWWGH